jgi:hypothetical protein
VPASNSVGGIRGFLLDEVLDGTNSLNSLSFGFRANYNLVVQLSKLYMDILMLDGLDQLFGRHVTWPHS